YSNNFNVFDWMAAIIVILINIAFVGFLLIRIYQLLRKYIRFVKIEQEKEYLLEEIAVLSQRTSELTDEKNKILALKLESFGMNPELFQMKDDSDNSEVNAVKAPSRFVKLIAVDEEYKDEITTVSMRAEDMLSLRDLVTRFINFSASRLKLYYQR